MWIFIIISIVLAVILVISKIKENNMTVSVPQTENEEAENTTKANLPYIRKNLLTKNEWYFYKDLKPIADKLNLAIIAKVRLADLVEVQKGLTKSEWQTAFNQINKKHIDFVLCNPENLYPILLIELDDSTHQQEKQKQRDEFVENLYQKTGYKLLRVNGSGELEEKINNSLLDKADEAENAKLKVLPGQE